MNIQTFSLVVPTKGCINKCPFCVSRMHCNKYDSMFDEFQMTKRIKWAVMNNINTCIITGIGEALQNIKFLVKLAELFEKLGHPFPNIELQTTGVLLEENIILENSLNIPKERIGSIELLQRLGINTIGLSVSNIFVDERNMEIIGVSENLKFNLSNLISNLKHQGFNIRLSINMIKDYDNIRVEHIFDRCKKLGADQVTFRKMYAGNDNSEQSEWVKNNACKSETISNIKKYIAGYNLDTVLPHHVNGKGKLLYELPFGGEVYSVDGMSVVIDSDCMSKDNNKALKYVILRENGKLYAQWDDNGSLIF